MTSAKKHSNLWRHIKNNKWLFLWSRTHEAWKRNRQSWSAVSFIFLFVSVSAPSYLEWWLSLTVWADFVILPKTHVILPEMTHFFMTQVSVMEKWSLPISATLFNDCGNLYCKVDVAQLFRITESHTCGEYSNWKHYWMWSLWVISGMCDWFAS